MRTTEATDATGFYEDILDDKAFLDKYVAVFSEIYKRVATTGFLESPDAPKCSKCDRGREACSYCHDVAQEDFEAICDCGLVDYGFHLLDCESMDEEFLI